MSDDTPTQRFPEAEGPGGPGGPNGTGPTTPLPPATGADAPTERFAQPTGATAAAPTATGAGGTPPEKKSKACSSPSSRSAPPC